MRRLVLRQFASAPSIKIENPYSLEIIAEVPFLSLKEAQARVESSANFANTWKKVPLQERIQVIRSGLSNLWKMSSVVAEDVTKMVGKPISQSLEEIRVAQESSSRLVDIAPKALEDVVVLDTPQLYKKITKEPLGVVMTMAPYSSPVHIAMNQLLPAILSGNTVLVKHSPYTATITKYFTEAFAQAGVPHLITDFFVQVKDMPKLLENRCINYVNFVGSVENGKELYQTLADARIMDVGLHLGAKNAAYVRHDADVDIAVKDIVGCALYNAGQSSTSIERILVDERVYGRFVELAMKEMMQQRIGDPMDEGTTLGPLPSPDAPARLTALIEEAVQGKCTVKCGGSATADESGKGRFFEPTLLCDLEDYMRVFVSYKQSEEFFGPIVAVDAAGSDEEVVKRINALPYGLSTSIYTADKAKAMELASQIETGTVLMNACRIMDPELPWSGWKDSGKHALLSHYCFRYVTRTKSYYIQTKAS